MTTHIPPARATVLVTSRSFGSGRSDLAGRLARAGLIVVSGPPDHDLSRLRPLLADAVAWIAGAGPVRAEHLDAAAHLRIVARYGTGVDAVDVAAADARGVVVTNTPGANAESVADHTIALILATLRHVIAADRAVRSGDWSVHQGRELGALTTGLVGFGAVGRAVGRRLAGFGGQVRASDPYVPRRVIAQHGAEPVADLARLAASCEVLSLHLPGGARVVDAALLRRMPHGGVLVNTARADLVDDAAVVAALGDGRLGGVGTDVLSPDSPLLTAPNVVVTPHLAAQTVEAADRMGATAVDEVLRVLSGEEPLHRVPAERKDRR